jgi:hypothetical protein
MRFSSSTAPALRGGALFSTAPALRGGALFHPLLSVVIVLLGCNSQRPPPTPARFEQPNAVDFVCVVNDALAPLNKCQDDSDDDNGIAMHALVTQHSRGEVASVDLEQHDVFDSRRDIPGYTFVPVGQLPVAIIVPPDHPEVTYVADFGSRDVRVLDTLSLVTPLSGTAELQNVALMAPSDAGMVPAAPTQMVMTPNADALLLTIPEQGRVLWLPIQRCAAKDAPTNCHEGLIDTARISSIALSGSADRIVEDDGTAPEEEQYEKLCGYRRVQPKAAAPIKVSGAMLEPAPRPSGFAIDAFCPAVQSGQPATDCKPRILVSDEALPLIHAIDLGAIEPGTDSSDALLPPLVVGVATKAVAVTPRVPVAIGSQEETQYVYAIDAVDGSVLATEHGRVLNVNTDPSARPDRIGLSDVLHFGVPPAAAALTVLTPWFNVKGPAAQYVTQPGSDTIPAKPETNCLDEDHTEESPARLRGVFLAVAAADGTVRIVDVHDMELLDVPVVKTPCRACPPQRIPAVVRNQERQATNFIFDADQEQVPLTPFATQFAFVVDAKDAFNIRPDGTNGSPSAPRLACLACGRGLSRIFPSATDEPLDTEDEDGGTSLNQEICSGTTPALLCAGDDPWTTSGETWTAVYEGVIPGSSSGDGRFVAPKDAGNRTGSPEVEGRVDFCAAGVLGGDSITAEDTGSDCNADADAPAGDQLVVTSPLLDSQALTNLKEGAKDDCAEALTAMNEDPTLRIAFGIRRAYRDRVVIDANLVKAIGKLKTYEQVQGCLGNDPMSFDVHTRNSFTVLHGNFGFDHRVKADGTGRCVVDSAADPLRRARARLGCTFQNHAFELRPLKPGPDDPVQVPPADLALTIQIATPSTKLISNLANLGFGNASVVPVALRYNAIDRRLYLVDIQDRGLVPMSLDPFASGVDTTETFN